MEQEKFTGVLEDIRPDAVKQLDPVHDEILGASAPTPTWVEKPQANWKSLTPRNQDGDDACVMFATASSVEGAKKTGFPLSPHDLYTRRSNYPNPGTVPMEGLQIACAWGVAKESAIPSDGFNEEQINIIPNRTISGVEENIGAGGIPTVAPLDINTLASILATGLFPVICLKFAYNEWAQKIPQIIQGAVPNLAHENVIVDYTLFEGKPYLISQDSWEQDTSMLPGQHRLINQAFLTSRAYFAGYIYYPSGQTLTPNIPEYTFNNDISTGMNNNDVLMLQTKLQALGFFTDTIKPTGYFGGLSMQAVISFQKKYGIPQTGYVGPITRAKLNSL